MHHAAEADEIWHAGDWLNLELYTELKKLNKTIRAVWGNADGTDVRNLFPKHLHFEIEGLKVYMTHIGGYPGKYNAEAIKNLLDYQPSVFVCGHSHILRVERDADYNGMLVINPGACGLQGFHKVLTALRFQIDAGKPGKMEAIEFGKRN